MSSIPCCCSSQFFSSFNFEFLRTTEGIIKLTEVILGGICQNLLFSYGLIYAVSLGSSFYSLLTTVSGSFLTSTILLICYILSKKSFQLVRQSLLEILLNGIISFLYVSSSSYLAFTIYSFLYPLYKLTSIFEVFSSLSSIYIIGFILGSVHGYDSWIAYKRNH